MQFINIVNHCTKYSYLPINSVLLLLVRQSLFYTSELHFDLDYFLKNSSPYHYLLSSVIYNCYLHVLFLYLHCVTCDSQTLNNGTDKLEKENKEKHKEVEGTVTPEKKTKVKRSLLCYTLTPGLLQWSGGRGWFQTPHKDLERYSTTKYTYTVKSVMPINMTIQQMAWKKKLKKNTKKLNELSDLENKIEQNRKRLLFVENFFNLLILEPKQFFQNFWVTNRSYTENNINHVIF